MLFETTNFTLFSRMIHDAITNGLFFEAGQDNTDTYFIKYSGQ